MFSSARAGERNWRFTPTRRALVRFIVHVGQADGYCDRTVWSGERSFSGQVILGTVFYRMSPLVA